MIDTGPRAARRMDLTEYVEFVEQEVDVDDFDSVVESAWALRALANDRNFVIDNYHDEMKAYWEGYSDNKNLPVAPARSQSGLLRAYQHLAASGGN